MSMRDLDVRLSAVIPAALIMDVLNCASLLCCVRTA